MKYEIDKNVIDQLIKYLATKPYKEVFALLQALGKELEKSEGEKQGG